jgi:hypothetical protein
VPSFSWIQEGEKGSDVFESVITRMGLVTKIFERKQERQILLTPADYARNSWIVQEGKLKRSRFM